MHGLLIRALSHLKDASAPIHAVCLATQDKALLAFEFNVWTLRLQLALGSSLPLGSRTCLLLSQYSHDYYHSNKYYKLQT